jgi:hypothetical protein
MDEWMDRDMGRLRDGWTGGQTDGRSDEWTFTNEWTDGRTDGWTDG